MPNSLWSSSCARVTALRSMLLGAALVCSAAPSLSAQPDRRKQDTTRALPANDPLAGEKTRLSALSAQARAQQDQFERNHRQGLRFYNGGADAFCEVNFGGDELCYWNNNGDVPPPDERNDAKLERLELLQLLKQANEAEPKDDWVVGMRVRYAIEAAQLDSALMVARACQGTDWWCASLEGLAAHVANRHEAATRAFTRALELMPATQRCQWTDLTWIIDQGMAAKYNAIPCANREAENTRILRLAQPLWMIPSNDMTNEMYARWTISRVHSLGRVPYEVGFSKYMLQSQVRYGWPTAWSIQNGGVADPRPPSVIGHEPTPSFDFMPTPAAIDKPVGASDKDWNFKRKNARMRYAPRYTTSIGALPHQWARFRRGDTTIVAAGYRLVRDLEMGRAPYTAAITLDGFDGRPPKQVKKDSVTAAGALLINMGTAPMLASLEVLAPLSKRAARARETVTPLPVSALISDYLVLVRGDPSATPTLEASAKNAYGSLEIEGGTTIGLYWEMYRSSTPLAPLSITIKATRIGASFFQKLGSSIGLSKAVTPVAIKFADNGRQDGGFGRSLTINFPPVPDGEYQLTVAISGAGVADSTTQRIRVKNGNK